MIPSIQSALRMFDAQTVAGYVYDDARPGTVFVVEILLDDIPAAAIRADAFSPALAGSGQANHHHGFVYSVPATLLASTRFVTARLANLGTPVGEPIDLDQLPRPDPLLAAQGAVEGVEGLVISGWINGPTNGAALVRAEIGGEEVAATAARIWTSRPIGGKARPVLSFALRLPAAIVTGETHMVAILTASGTALANSPVRVDTAAL